MGKFIIVGLETTRQKMFVNRDVRIGTNESRV